MWIYITWAETPGGKFIQLGDITTNEDLANDLAYCIPKAFVMAYEVY